MSARREATWARATVIVAYMLIPLSVFAPPWGPYQFENTGTKYTLWGVCVLLAVAHLLARRAHPALEDEALRKRMKRIMAWSLVGYLFVLAMWTLAELGGGLAAAGA